MGKLPNAPFEVRLAATLFLALLGLANLFGAWQVRNFASFTPSGLAATVAPAAAPAEHSSHMAEMGHMAAPGEIPVDPESLDHGGPRIDHQLLVQDSHVHIPMYAITAAFLAGILFALRLSSRVRVVLVWALFSAPFLDFAGLWGAHLFRARLFWSGLALAGGFAMGAAYLVVLVLAVSQCWFSRKEASDA